MIFYPYPLTFLADRLPIQFVRWDIQRNDAVSGTGDGRIWQAELSDPLWRADVQLQDNRNLHPRKIAALIRKLHGAQESFWLYDPRAKFPAADPKGLILGEASVEVDAIGVGRQSIGLTGLPPGYELTAGDKGQLTFSTSKTFFFEFSEDAVADGTGVIDDVEVFPHVPPGVLVGDAVILARPACQMIIMPGSHNPGDAGKFVTRGASFSCVERRR